MRWVAKRWTMNFGGCALGMALCGALVSVAAPAVDDSTATQAAADKPAASNSTAKTDKATDAETYFRQNVAPIFERRCVQCHTEEDTKGGLRLDSAAKALAGGESGKVIEPGDPSSSLLVDYISGDKPEMPKKGQPLSADEVAAIRNWIADGAHWPANLALRDKRFEGQRWWSLAPLVRPAVPAATSAWVRTPVDAFILDMLGKQGLRPSAEADRRTLIRRLYFDLHGLPPAPEEVDAFVADKDPRAYERLVDRLLDSPRYGERWGRHWLDAVHYGDTHGYDKDKVRPNAWPYRDYVIRSLNAGKPYSRFVEEQLAGDVLFPGSSDGVVATGFIVAGPWDFVGHVELREGTIDKQITRSLDRDDMVMNAMSTFSSLTVHCARCHNHKFDPIPQKDYYRLQAVFAGVERADRPYDANPAAAEERRALQQEQQRLQARERELAAAVENLKSPELREFDRRIAALSTRAGKPLAMPTAADRTLGYHSQIVATADAAKWVQVDLGKPQPIEQVLLFPANEAYMGWSGPGFGFPVRFKVEASNDATFATGVTLLLDRTAADHPNPGDVPLAITPPEKLNARYVRLTATKLWERTNDFALALSELVVLSDGKNVAVGAPVIALDSIEAGRSWGKAHLVDGFIGKSSIALASKSEATSPSNGYHSAIMATAAHEKWVQVDLGEAAQLDEIVLVPARPVDFADTPGFGFPARFRVELSDDPNFADAAVVFDQTRGDAPNPADVAVRIPASLLRDIKKRYVRVTATKLWPRSGDFVFALAELQAWSHGRNLAAGAAVEAKDSIEAGLWSKRFLVDGYSSRAPLDGESGFFARLVARSQDEREMAELSAKRKQLAAASLPAELRQETETVAKRLGEITKRLATLSPQQMVYAAAAAFPPEGNFTAAPSGRARPIHVLHRGSVSAPGEEVSPGAVSCVSELSCELSLPPNAGEGQRRAALARWITDKRNPLTWRSIVNRVWQYHFGQGIVATPNDFGRMGAEPTHPELLDWLAVEFRDGDQSLKSLHRLLVTSAVYRQTSNDDPAMAKIDAGNRFLWRMNRRRLESEAIRDATLTLAGKLDLTMGGPGFREFGFQDDHSPHYKYQEHNPDDPKSQRRSVYRFIVRSVPDPFMDTLDCADASSMVPKRNETLTSLQALALLNNKFMLRMAEHFADRVSRMAPTATGQINAAFRLAFGRDATADELGVLSAYAKEHGMSSACRVILNMNEFVFVD